MPAPVLKFIPRKPEHLPARLPPAARDYAGLTPAEREFLPHLLEIEETPPSPFKGRLLFTLVAVMAVLLIWSIAGQIDVVATAPGKFVPDGRIKAIQPVETSVIKAIHVKDGQHVKEGDLLIELDPALSVADLDSANRLYQQNRLEQARLIAELKGGPARYASGASREAIALQEALREARLATYQTKLAAARAAVEEKQSALASAESQLKKAESNVRIAAERENKMAKLLESNFISRMEYLKNIQELESSTHERDAQVNAVEQQRHALRQAREQLNVIEQEWRAGVLADLDRGVTAQPGLQRDRDKAQRVNDLKLLRAPVAGYVQAVGVTTLGGVVTPAQTLVTIVPENTPLLVEAILSNEDVGHVRVGQKADIKVDTYPFQKYGTLKGALVWVSPDAEPREAESRNGAQDFSTPSSDSSQKPAKPAYAYKAHIRADPDAKLIVAGAPARLQAGMTAQADIITDKRRIIEFFLSPVVKYLDEGMKVR